MYVTASRDPKLPETLAVLVTSARTLERPVRKHLVQVPVPRYLDREVRPMPELLTSVTWIQSIQAVSYKLFDTTACTVEEGVLLHRMDRLLGGLYKHIPLAKAALRDKSRSSTFL